MKAIFKYIEYIFTSWVQARDATVATRFGRIDEAREIMSRD